jgi:hypothetical protein
VRTLRECRCEGLLRCRLCQPTHRHHRLCRLLHLRLRLCMSLRWRGRVLCRGRGGHRLACLRGSLNSCHLVPQHVHLLLDTLRLVVVLPLHRIALARLKLGYLPP